MNVGATTVLQLLDPNDPYSFWTIQEFAAGTDDFGLNLWGTQITQIRVVPESTSALSVLVSGAVGAGMLLNAKSKRLQPRKQR